MWPVEKKMLAERANRAVAELAQMNAESPIFEAAFLAERKAGATIANARLAGEKAVSESRKLTDGGKAYMLECLADGATVDDAVDAARQAQARLNADALDLDFLAETDTGLVKLRSKCVKLASKYKRADIVAHYAAIMARIDAFNGVTL